MRPAGPPSRETADGTTLLRRRRVPTRVLADKVIVARPGDGAPVVFAATAAFVWRLLEGWTTASEIDRRLADAFPEIAEADRVTARIEILAMLQDEDLVERR